MANRATKKLLHKCLDAILYEYPSGYEIASEILETIESHIPYQKDSEFKAERDLYLLVVDLRKVVKKLEES